MNVFQNTQYVAYASAAHEQRAESAQSVPSVSANTSGRRSQNVAYSGAEINQLTKDWLPGQRSADSAILSSWNILNPRMRDLILNSPTVIAAQRELVKHIVGTGIITMADVFSSFDENGMPVYEEEFNFESDDSFDHWATEEFDIESRKSFADAQWQSFGETVGVGESFFLECMSNDPARSVPVAYQVLEPEQIDQTKDRIAGESTNRIVRGIELDKFNRPVAYYVYDAHPYDQWSGWTSSSTRIPASRIIHQFMPMRPSQTRGMSWLAAIMQPSRDVDWYLTNELTAAAISALLTLIIKRENPNRGGLGLLDDGDATDAFSNELVKLGRANVAEIGAKDDIHIAESARPNSNAGPFLKLMMEQAGMAAGVSYVRLTNDVKGASYTSIRGSHLNDAAFFRPIQNWMARKTVVPIRRRHTAVAVARGLLSSVSARHFNQQYRRWTRLHAQGPGREQLDPEMETDAALGRIRGGLSSLPEEAALMGRNWRKTLQHRARSEAYAKKLGVTLDFSKGASPPSDSKDRKGTEQDQEAA